MIPAPDGFITRVVGLDFSAVLMTAQARFLDTQLLAEILPRIEEIIVNRGSDAADIEEDGDGDA